MVMGRLVVMGTESAVEFVPLSGRGGRDHKSRQAASAQWNAGTRAETALSLENSEGAVGPRDLC